MVWIFRVYLFSQIKENLGQNTPNNLEPYFDFVFHVCVFAKDLKICKIAKFDIRKNIMTLEKGIRVSILSGVDASSARVLVGKATFTVTLHFHKNMYTAIHILLF